MKRTVARASLSSLFLLLAGCGAGTALDRDAGSDADIDSDSDSDSDADADADTDTGDPIPLTAVDLLVVVDNSMGAWGEQPILGTGLFVLAGAMLHPLPSSPYAAVDDLRIAAITTDMGFSYGDGQNNNDNWPGSSLPSGCDTSDGLGDDGAFQGMKIGQVTLPIDVVPCDSSGAQCPEGWTCQIDTGDEGVCHTDDTTSLNCPDLDGAWAETTPEAANPELALMAACLARQGYGGCGFEQQLASMARSVTREDQIAFVRDDAVLAAIVMTTEDDCSMEDGPGMFAEDEIVNQDELKLNVACGNHPEHLFPSSYFYETFTQARGRDDAVVYLAIAGVPWGEQAGASACQGPGDAIGDCLEQEEMQFVPVQPNADQDPPDSTWFPRLACNRFEDEVEVTQGYPARRLVELATDFGANGYAYSVCNEDWTPAFDALGAMIREKLAI